MPGPVVQGGCFALHFPCGVWGDASIKRPFKVYFMLLKEAGFVGVSVAQSEWSQFPAE
jgi:hypothetical protein